MADQSASASNGPISPAKRRRLQQAFEHANKMSSAGNFDYATELYTQCVLGDPGNLLYVANFLGNLQKKYNNNKKGGKLAGVRSAGAKGAVKKALVQKNWDAVIKNGLEVLKYNPWDVSTLTAMARACEEREHDECELAYLKAALEANINDPEINRLAGKALARQGKFDEAIICWHRVTKAKPDDAEAKRAIGDLTVEKTIHKGGYEEAESSRDVRANPQDDARGPQLTPERQLEKAIEKDPADPSNYLKLAQLYERREELEKVEELLQKALDASGGDIAIRERLEDLQIRRKARQVAQAKQRAVAEKTQEAVNLYRKLVADLNRMELELYRDRVERYPNNVAYRFELGLRLKRAGMYREAIEPLQKAREDPRHKGEVLLALGECFQQIKQYRLAMSNYEASLKALGDKDSEERKRALYLAGCLAQGLKEFDKAEAYLTQLAELDFSYRDVAQRLDKIAQIRDKG